MDAANTTKTNGRPFQPGNKAAVGHSSKSQRLRAAMLKAVSEADVRSIVKALVLKAKGGDIDATKILFGFIGKPQEPPVVVPVGPSVSGAERGRSLARDILARLRAERAAATPNNP